MVFSSTVFLCLYLPLVLLLYRVVPARWRNGFLFVMSLLFYAWGEPVYMGIMLFSTAFDYVNGLLIERCDKRHNLRGKKWVMILSVVINLAILGFFKYTDFLLENLNALAGTNIGLLRIALPIGISFYTFQTMSYTLDVYRGTVAAQHNIINFGMYVCLFPQLIAGPIVRYSDIAEQVDTRTETPARFAQGIRRFTVGLAKKVLLANQFGALWDAITAEGAVLPAGTAWLGAVAFSFQIYFDFSGYSDMAIGLGKMFGFDFPENFRYPYESDSITDFWRRWHITLSTWFREYLYIPLGGNRRGLPRQIFNLLVVWFLTGLWHGAGWNFILWGLYFFVILVLEKLFLLRWLQKAPAVVRHGYALLLIVLGWVIFACDDLTMLGQYFRSLFGLGAGGADNMTLYYLLNYLVLLLLAVVGSTQLPAHRMRALQQRQPRVAMAVQIGLGTAVFLISLAFLVGDSYNPFLYFRF